MLVWAGLYQLYGRIHPLFERQVACDAGVHTAAVVSTGLQLPPMCFGLILKLCLNCQLSAFLLTCDW
jgi:hypothetical protein